MAAAEEEYPDSYFFEGGVGQSASRVNGEFHKSSQKEGGRPVYIHDDNGKDVALWYWKKKSFWMISPRGAIGTQNAYACVRNSKLPHEINSGWLVFSKENQNYVPSSLTAVIAGDEEDSSDSDSIDAQLLKPRERSKTPELDGAEEYEDKARERSATPEEEKGINADQVRFLKNPAPRTIPDEEDDADDIIEDMADDAAEREEANEEEEERTPKAPRDARYFMHDTRQKAPGRAKGRCHMDDPEESDDDAEEKEEGEKENTYVEREPEVVEEEEVEERPASKPKKNERWGHEFFERMQKGEKIESWESSSFNTNRNNRRRGGRNFNSNYGGGRRSDDEGRDRRRNNYSDRGAGRGSGVDYEYGRQSKQNDGDDYGYDRRTGPSGRAGARNDYGNEYGGRGDSSYNNPYEKRNDEPQRYTRGGRRGRRSRGRGGRY